MNATLFVNDKWLPSCGIVKLNVDGSYNDCTRHSGCGGLLRTNDGKWLRGFSSKVLYADITLVELVALKQGLMLAWDCGYRELIRSPRSTSAGAISSDLSFSCS